MLLSPEKMEEAVAVAEELAVQDAPDEVEEVDVKAEEEVVVEAKQDDAPIEPAETGDLPEQNSGEVAAEAAVPEEEPVEASDAVLSSEEEAWLDKYLSDDEDDEPEELVDHSEVSQLRQRLDSLEKERAVSLATRQLESEIRTVSQKFKSVAVEDIIAAVQSNPQINVESWTAREAARVKAVEARVEARVRKDLKLEKRARADERSPPRGQKTGGTAATGRKYQSVNEASAGLRADILAGRFG